MDRSDLTPEQDHAVETIDANYPLIAGAGTGKTTTLSFRYVELLSRNPDLSPREILVTTFTKRAARELVGSVRERVLHRIRNAESEDVGDGIEEGDRLERWQSVLDDLDEAYIHTLHAFCQRVLQEYAFEAPRVERGFDVIDDIEANRLQDEAIDEVIEERSNSVETLVDSNVVSEDSLRDVLGDLFGKRPRSSEWATYWSHPESDVDEYVDYVENAFHPLPDETARQILSDDLLRKSIDSLREFLENPPVSDRGNNIKRISAVIERVDEAGGLDGPNTVTERRRLIADLSGILTTNKGNKYSGYSPKKGGWQDSDERRKEIGEVVEDVADVMDAVRWTEEMGDVSSENDRHSAPFVFAIARLFDTADEKYASKKRDRNLVDYTDLVEMTEEILGDEFGSTQVRQRLREQFRYVMVDEVQDTDPAQWGIIGELTRLGDSGESTGTEVSVNDRKDQTDSGTEAPIPTAGERYRKENVFVVGDEKQSIYRFRGADVEVFEENRSELTSANSETIESLVDGKEGPTVRTGEKPGFELAQNFRTLPETLEFINAVFNDIFLSGFDTDGDTETGSEAVTEVPLFEAPPQPLSPTRDNIEGIDPVVEYLFIPDEDLAPEMLDPDHYLLNQPMYHRRSAEALSVAARITRLIDDEIPVYPDEDDEKGPRPVEPRDIAVILRKRTHLAAFKRAFEEMDIPYSVVQGEGFFETTEIRALMNLLKAVDDPTDEISLYAVLRSPMFGVDDDTLAPYADEDNFWEALLASNDESIRKATEIIQELCQMAGVAEDGFPENKGWEKVVDHALERTGFMASVGGDERPRQAVANIDRFRNMVDSKDDLSSLGALIERLEEEIEQGDRSPEATVPEGDTGVQMLTVHAAKGSEFPVVVVPGICDGFNTNSPIGNGMEFETVDGRPALGFKVPDPKDPFETVDTVARNGIRKERLRRARAEEKRTLYVACTRARDHLILAGTHKGEVTEDGGIELEEVDEESPSSWRDMLQPITLNDETMGRVAAEGSTRAKIKESLVREDAEVIPEYSIRVPESPADISARGRAETPTVESELGRYVPDEASYRLSPSSFADLMSENPDGELVYDSDRNVVRYSTEEKTEKDKKKRHEEVEIGAETEIETEDEDEDETEISPSVFGEAVHRICELQPDRSEWKKVIIDTVVSEDADPSIAEDDEVCEKIYSHADRAWKFVESMTTPETVRYDELELTAQLDGGQFYGFIDCLLVQDGGSRYHVIDYKTGDYDLDQLDEKTEHYQPQLDAYAAMLSVTADPKEVETTLYYTSCDIEHSERYVGDELQEVESRVDRSIQEMAQDKRTE